MIAHEYAGLFPMLPDAELERLAADIAENGLQTPITTLDGKILDGRNRFRACEIAGVDPTMEEYQGGDPLAFVISHNLHRRHLTESQRGMVAAKMANLNNGERPPYIDGGAVTQASAKEMLKVGESTVTRAKKIQRFGSPELNAAVESGELTVGAAHKVASLPHEEQSALVAAGPAAVKARAKEITQAAIKPEPEPDVEPEPESEPEPLVVDGSAEAPEPARMAKWVHSDADRLWLLARTDQIGRAHV